MNRSERNVIRRRLMYFRAHPLHVGRHTGKTLYDGDGPHDDIGRMDTPSAARAVVQLSQDAIALEDELDALVDWVEDFTQAVLRYMDRHDPRFAMEMRQVLAERQIGG